MTTTTTGQLDKDEVLARLTPSHIEALYRAMGVERTRRDRDWLACRSPFREDSTDNPSFRYHPEHGGFTDFATDEKGDVFEAVMRWRGCGFAEALAYLAEQVGAVRRPPGRQIVTAYDYTDEAGVLLSQTVRYQPKAFSQRRPDGRGGWAWNLDGVRRVPYRLPELLAADPIVDVLIVAGEKDADNAAAAGFVATTNALGEGNWHAALNPFFAGRHVVLIPDNDDPGRRHVADVARHLAGLAETIKVVTLPDLPAKGDLSDWLAAGGTAERLTRLILAAPEWTPPAEHDAPAPADAADDEPERRPRFTLYTPAQLKARPPMTWLVDELLVDDSLSAIHGGPGSFKSFLALDLALSVAGGHAWHGRAVRGGPVLYISAEGSKGVPKRIAAWEAHHDRTASESCHFITDAVQFIGNGDIDDVLLALADLPAPPVLIVVDTLARTMLGHDENGTKDMGLYIAGADRLRVATGAHVAILHHNNRAETMRGNTALPGALDTIIAMKRDDDIVTVSCEKQKDAEEFDKFHLLRRIVDVGIAGDTSIVLAPTDQQRDAVTVSDRKALRLLADTFGPEGATASQWEAVCTESGMGRSTYFLARKHLLASGLVTVDKEGRGGRFKPSLSNAENGHDVV